MKKCLVTELWWIGDATLMTSILQGLLADGWDVTVLGKTVARRLLEAEYPQVHWIEFEAPWTAFHGKYRLWTWPWAKLFQVMRAVRRGRFDAAVSTRCDPRDHVLLWLAAVPRRIGFRSPLGRRFLNEATPFLPDDRHRVEDWWEVQERVSATATALFPPRLEAKPASLARFRELFARDGRPVLALHCGARIAVRRWPEPYLRELILRLRGKYDFQMALFPDLDGYGRTLGDLAEHTLEGLSLDDLKAALGAADLVLANDSGPGHLADALGVPVITIFGSGSIAKMRPFSARNLVILRDICPHHPCSDYCRFAEPYCLTQLSPATAGAEMERYLDRTALLPRRGHAPHNGPAGMGRT